jgi:GNAT superfamily N-acetyltransferase
MNEIFLCDLKIDENSKINFYQSKSLCHSPAYSFFLKTTSLMIESGFVLPITDWADTRCGLIYGKNKNKIISFILYDLDYDQTQRNQTLLISKTFVDETYRRKKIYSKMQELLINFAKELGYNNLATITNKNNNEHLECLKKLGLSFVCYQTWKEVT